MVGTIFNRIGADEVVYRVRLGVGDLRILIELSSDIHSSMPIPSVGSIYYVYVAIDS